MKTQLPFSINEHQLVDYIHAQGRYVLRREIARAFRIKANDKCILKKILQNLEQQNLIKRRGKSYCGLVDKSSATVKITHINELGEMNGELISSELPNCLQSNLIEKYQHSEHHLNIDDRIIVNVKLSKSNKQIWTFVRKLSSQPIQILGFVQDLGKGKFVLQPIDRKVHDQFPLIFEDQNLAQKNAFIEAELIKSANGTLIARGITLLKKEEHYISKLSLIAAYKYDLPQEFSKKAMLLAAQSQLPGLEDRVDIRDLQLVTIDDQDARDHDDAVYCEPIHNSQNWRLIVAIADVSHFVKVNDFLDQEALARANSVYFPDQVIPMLPEKLSNDLCSLKPNVDRPCLVADLIITPRGKLESYKFYNAMMRSWGKLTYKGVQSVLDGDLKMLPPQINLETLQNLQKVYQFLKKARSIRGTLDFDLPEKKVVLDSQGNIKSVLPRHRLESNQLIEEMMIIANVAAAQYLNTQPVPPLYRVHDEPRQERLEDLRNFLESTSVSLPRGQALRPINFMHILNHSKDLVQGPAIHELILRAQSQAQYSPDNIGHFGLNLSQYCHFTSPIRRYADLIVHRAIKAKIAKKLDFYPYNHEILESIGQEISDKERRSAKAERDTIERYVAKYMQNQIGKETLVQINGITNFALFVTHLETGADGILPLRQLIGDYFTYFPNDQWVKGRRSGRKFRLGDQFQALLTSANWMTGSLIFSLDIQKVQPKYKLKKISKKRINKLKKTI